MAQETKQNAMKRLWRGLLVPLVAVCLMVPQAMTSTAAAAKVAVTIDLSQQRMYVAVGGRPSYTWTVSTARPGYRTPTGTFRPIRMERVWYSTIYHHSPMPYSIFFSGGYAIHGTYETRYLGRPVSHGCVRLTPSHARTLFNLVIKYGRSNTLITVRR